MTRPLISLFFDPGDRPAVVPYESEGIQRISVGLGGPILFFESAADARAWGQTLLDQLEGLEP